MNNSCLDLFSKNVYDNSKCLYTEFDNISLAITKRTVDAKNMDEMKVLFDELGFNHSNATFNNQIHSADVRKIFDKDISTISDADALITNIKGVPLVVFTADCVPIAMIDKENQAIAVVHAGWRGTYGNIVTNTINAMKDEYGTDAADLEVVIGPAICVDSYNVSQDLIDNFRDMLHSVGIVTESFYKKNEETYYLDLNFVNEELMINSGVKKENIHNTNICTFLDDDFFSYRKDSMTPKRIGTVLEMR